MVDSGAVVKEIQQMRDEGYLSDPILRKAIRAIKTGGDKYDWVGAYLLDEEKSELWLHNYVGKPSPHARIKVGEGVCGTAVAERKNQNVPDVSKVENYLACNPRVKSELVVLIRAGDTILGQIDLDSNTPAAFGEEDEKQVGAVADKLAEVLMAERR